MTPAVEVNFKPHPTMSVSHVVKGKVRMTTVELAPIAYPATRPVVVARLGDPMLRFW
jgi:hypothetical protein